MISAVIPTLDAERHLGRTLAALIPAAVDGLVREVIIAVRADEAKHRDVNHQLAGQLF